MKIAVIGAGAVGSYYGVKLALTGNDVVFIARGERLDYIHDHGITVNLPDQEIIHYPANATDQLTTLQDRDLILVTTKSWQIRDLAFNIHPHISGEAILLPFGNGIQTVEDLTSSIPAEQVLGGQCLIFCKHTKDGNVSCISRKPLLTFGEPDHSISRRIIMLKDVFIAAGIDNKVYQDIQADMWRKFMLVCTSSLGAITHEEIGQLRVKRHSRRMMIEIFMEIKKLANRQGIYLGHDIVRKSLSIIDHLPQEASSSLSRDILEHKHSELEYQNGTVVRMGRMLGIPTPTNEYIYNLTRTISIPEHEMLLDRPKEGFLLQPHR